MKLFLPPIHQRSNFNAKDPFSHDSFNRKQFADNLTNLIRASFDGCVISIDAEWGGGKTTFIQLWRHQLMPEDTCIPVYYDAFAHDFSSNPFISISATIHDALSSGKDPELTGDKNERQIKKIVNTGKNLAINLAASTIAIGTSALTAGLVSSDEIKKEIADAAKDATKDALSVESFDPYQLYSEQETLIKDYKRMVGDILKKTSGEKKVVVFIDELDRCRPDFAVEVIEKVKHLFDIPNVFFVISFNRKQMLSTISSVYGVQEEEAEIYFQKFIHIETKLPEIDYSQKGLTVVSVWSKTPQPISQKAYRQSPARESFLRSCL